MNPLKIFAFLCLFCSLVGCSVYKSAGRKSFESRAPDAVRNQQSFTTQTEDEMCWNQPAAEPLWEINSNQNLVVTKLGDDQIQVCALGDTP
jgi:hypothetical protein